MGIDELHNGHGSHQEEEDAADFFHVVQQAMFKEHGQTSVAIPHVICREQMVFLRQMRGDLVPTQHKQRPAHRASHQRRGCFVNVDVVL